MTIPLYPLSRRRGFALIATVTILVLLSLVAVGLLTLSTLTVRSASQGEAQAEARANARLALALALGDLQKTLGPDRAVSAPASSLSSALPARPHIVGAWESWHWEPAAGSSPDYSQKRNRFRKWLVSAPDPADTEALAFKDVVPRPNDVWLVNPATTGAPAGRPAGEGGVRAGIVESTVPNHEGGLAWVVFDESTKAPISLVEDPFDNAVERVSGRAAARRPRADVLAEVLAPLQTATKLVSLDTAVLSVGKANRSEILGRIHDFTTDSRGVLADVGRGGLKQDLTTLLESGENLAEATGTADSIYLPTVPSSVKWDYLRDHYQNYRDIRDAADGQPLYNLPGGDRAPGRSGIDEAPTAERLLPVIAKLQMVFSIVTHYNHIGDRIAFFNQYGRPKGNTNYGCPHLVYDPVITLYNPYDVALRLPQLRIRIWDPPVGFKFKKNGDYLRPEFESPDGFHGLARFQIQNERNENARKYFTLLLKDPQGGVPRRPIDLLPGEVKVYAPYVERQWTWSYETRGGYGVHAFFDWNQGNDFGNKDGRARHNLGLEATHGWDVRAGLQTDHLSYATRPVATHYDFERERNWDGGWLGIKNTDTFSVECKALRVISSSNEPDFAVDLLAGRNDDTNRDLLRSYQFRFGDATAEISETPEAPVIERTFRVGDLLQTPADRSPGGKTPFAVLTMSAKTTADSLDVSKPWVYNNPVVEGGIQDTRQVGQAMQSYDLTFREVTDFNTFPGVELDPDTFRGYYGAHTSASEGVTNVPMHKVPVMPAVSLGDLTNANLAASATLPRVTHPFGSGHAHPLIPSAAVAVSSGPGGDAMLDHAYLLNDALWDRFYFSSVTDYNAALAVEDGRDRKTVLEDLLNGRKRALNYRLVATTGGSDGATAAATLEALPAVALSRDLAAHLMVAGPFNVNSDSVDAWRAILSSLRDEAVRGWGGNDHGSLEKSAFPRASFPLAGDAVTTGDASFSVRGQVRWAGFRALDDGQIARLAEEIVKQVRRRGEQDGAPSLTLAEFVSRRVGAAGSLHALKGLLESAIDASGLNEQFHQQDSNLVTAADVPAPHKTGAANPEAFGGYTGETAPPMLSQGDLLAPLASIITVRGDTFKIRTYGEARRGGAVVAQAWCEAVVQRLPEFIDSSDAASTPPEHLTEGVNTSFGRRFIVQSFRWLAPEEV